MGDVGVYIVTMARTFADCFWKVSVTISSNMSVQTDLMLDYQRERDPNVVKFKVRFNNLSTYISSNRLP